MNRPPALPPRQPSIQARGRRHSGVRRRSRQALLRKPGMAARRRLARRRELARDAVHTSRVTVLDPFRHRHHDGGAGLNQEPLSRGVRHRGGARRTHRPRRRGEGAFHFDGFGGSPSRAPPPTVDPTQPSPRSATGTATAGCSGDQRRASGTGPQQPGRSDADGVAARGGGAARAGYQPTAPKHHWSDFYAAYIVARENNARGRGDPRRAERGEALRR